MMSPGRTVITVERLSAVVEINVHDPQLARRISASARIVTLDAHGCPTARSDADHLWTGREPDNPDARAMLVPARPSSVTTCGYDDGQLHVGATLGAAGARQLAATLNAAPRGGSLDVSDGDCQSPIAAPSYVLTFSYENASPVTVWVRIDGCGALGASNGTVVHQRTDLVIDAVGNASGLFGIAWSGAVARIAE